ncbi:hypothetical protein B0H14DRAFT_2605412 [Mycena olivaceomarginata]|nr:hypothetical protein B0H14DRAFT_2605412 [Mycena olivaceomarginata]
MPQAFHPGRGVNECDVIFHLLACPRSYHRTMPPPWLRFGFLLPASGDALIIKESCEGSANRHLEDTLQYASPVAIRFVTALNEFKYIFPVHFSHIYIQFQG